MQQQQNLICDENQRNIKDFYELTNTELGKGSYGRVQLSNLKGTNIKWAIKIIEKSKVSNVERFWLEVEIMMKLDHPNILRLIDYFEDPKYVYLVLELCTGGELFDRIIANKYFNEEDARMIFWQIMSALNYCHLNGVAHWDLKPENFIMISPKDPFTLKIIDFGLSRTFNTNDWVLKELPSDDGNRRRKTWAVLKTKAGTPFYIAPEVLTGNYNEKCDVWSAGVILYILLCGYPPFYGESNKQILDAVKAGKLDFSGPEWKDKSKEAIELIQKMITEQHQRMFTDQVLLDPWMKMSKIKIVFREKIKILYHNMKKFSKLDFLRKLILYFISKNLQEEDICHYHSYYFFFDQNNQGSIDKESFIKTIKENVEDESDDIGDVFEELNLFGKNKITYIMFICSVIPYSKLFSDKRLIIFYQICNSSGQPYISNNDLLQFLQWQFKYNNFLEQEKIETLCDQFKEMFKGNQRISFDQFSKTINEI